MFFDFRYLHLRLRKRPATPGVRSFATLNAIEAVVRGTVLSVYPVVLYRAFPDAAVVSQIYLVVGVISLFVGLCIPILTSHIPRRWAYTLGCGLYLLSAALGIIGGPFVAAALLTSALGAATVFVCHNAYVLDNIPKPELSRLETLRLFYGGVGWSCGPFLGVLLMQWDARAPFVITGMAALLLLGTFWHLRMGNGRVIARAKGKSPNPLAYLGRFFSQPRLITSWLFVVFRSVGWAVFIVYVGIFALEKGLGENIGGLATSLANATLFLAPLMLRWVKRQSVRFAVRTGFLGAAIFFALGTALAGWPWLAIAALMLGTGFLVLLDISGGLPFLMSVKPSERNEMAAVYSSFRDFSGIVSPGLAWLTLQFAPLDGVFLACGLCLFGCWIIAGQLHPELGVPGAERQRKGQTSALSTR
jgi:MFS transporter, ACDE family, multidrug resistance protein